MTDKLKEKVNMRFVQSQCDFPIAVIGPGEDAEMSVPLTSPFRPQRLYMQGDMAEVRGFFKLKHTRLPLLNRENVIAYSTITRYPKDRRTTVEYREGSTGNFVRSYLPKNVVYKHVDPLSYITLVDLSFDKRSAFPTPGGGSFGGGVSAEYFGPSSHGNGLPLPTGNVSINIKLKHTGDIPVKVCATMFGYEA